MILPNFSEQVVMALVYWGNDAQARADIRKRNEVLKTDFSKFSIPGHTPDGKPYFHYSNHRNDKRQRA